MSDIKYKKNLYYHSIYINGLIELLSFFSHFNLHKYVSYNTMLCTTKLKHISTFCETIRCCKLLNTTVDNIISIYYTGGNPLKI